ncbi:hypothetical protein K0U07_00280 [bacterium]|nr:hypothetical protein [bacterium]
MSGSNSVIPRAFSARAADWARGPVTTIRVTPLHIAALAVVITIIAYLARSFANQSNPPISSERSNTDEVESLTQEIEATKRQLNKASEVIRAQKNKITKLEGTLATLSTSAVEESYEKGRSQGYIDALLCNIFRAMKNGDEIKSTHNKLKSFAFIYNTAAGKRKAQLLVDKIKLVLASEAKEHPDLNIEKLRPAKYKKGFLVGVSKEAMQMLVDKFSYKVDIKDKKYCRKTRTLLKELLEHTPRSSDGSAAAAAGGGGGGVK